ncbi:LysR family transcriptional regulator [Enterocloster clostridioformis]|nr:LysR family transcriptional regulator [Enterocloster clostridioformis]NDO31518.1 LysR family transcriptional regulator [Enterocloster clostridioformis]QQQ98628.1 LysR family transcriptional regulator [Enterocloster clostridioformis]
MDMKEFTYLIALAEEGSISKAAQRLYMAQSSLSQFLQQFESELWTYVNTLDKKSRKIMLLF